MFTDKRNIIQILIDFPDKSIKYKNENEIGLELVPKNFEDINVKEDTKFFWKIIMFVPLHLSFYYIT